MSPSTMMSVEITEKYAVIVVLIDKPENFVKFIQFQ